MLTWSTSELWPKQTIDVLSPTIIPPFGILSTRRTRRRVPLLFRNHHERTVYGIQIAVLRTPRSHRINVSRHGHRILIQNQQYAAPIVEPPTDTKTHASFACKNHRTKKRICIKFALCKYVANMSFAPSASVVMAEFARFCANSAIATFALVAKLCEFHICNIFAPGKFGANSIFRPVNTPRNSTVQCAATQVHTECTADLTVLLSLLTYEHKLECGQLTNCNRLWVGV